MTGTVGEVVQGVENWISTYTTLLIVFITSTAGKDYTGLLEASKTHFYGPRGGLIGVLAYI